MTTPFSTVSNTNAIPLVLDSALNTQVMAIGDVLRERGWTASSAESCTGGGIAFAFTSVAGSSDWFNQSWVTYSNKAKTQELSVKVETLEAHGAVSQQTVTEMALGVQKRCEANVVITVSGIAGPGGGSDDKPVGTVWFGFICGDDAFQVKQVFSGNRDEVRGQAVAFAINYVLKMLSAS
ncbi:CinA family protein [Alteromonas sp.]|uniref:CinA family protein n=1 Tax=Alteromonas sp. TaxID=232 RepID=UPI000B682F13|nr:CinA family protein [Alteromonas sp.]MAI39534.1 damage-inducible protein CinA [Alteromonas sp.]OUX83656.1 MAG: damage-inducible protein CinA [Alteromonas sp. TMED35]|tara:strand:+ start:11343 stop:11882 length:540 start_codon:yes stop_codon:yes gene_type:complete